MRGPCGRGRARRACRDVASTTDALWPTFCIVSIPYAPIWRLYRFMNLLSCSSPSDMVTGLLWRPGGNKMCGDMMFSHF